MRIHNKDAKEILLMSVSPVGIDLTIDSYSDDIRATGGIGKQSANSKKNLK